MKTYFQSARSVPGSHQICSPLILPTNEVMEWDSGFPVKVVGKYLK